MMPYALHTRLTILRDTPSPTPDPDALALLALAWVLADCKRSDRLLALTGLTAEGLRAGLDDKAVLSAVLGFIASHEPDLVAAAQALEVEPQAILAAQQSLEQ